MTRAELEQIAREAAAQYNLPVDVFLRLINQESKFKVDALSPKGAYGPAQLMPDTAAELGVNREDPRENIFGGAKYLSQLLNQFGEMPLALAAYNAGMGNVKKYGGVPPFKETQNYLKAILGSTDGQPLSAMRNDAMVGNMQTPPIFPQQQPQRQGLQGLLQRFMQPSETTGLTGAENFAQALDALILPQARMGAQIRARGAQRLQTQSRNKTIETLKQRAAQGDKLAAMILQGLQSGAYDAKTAMSLYMGKMLETQKKPSQIQLYEYAKTTLGMDEAEARKWAKSSGDTIVDLGGGDAAKFNELDAKMLSEIGQAGLDAGSSLKRIDRLENLLMNVETGATATVKSIAGRYGIPTEGLSNIQAAEALINSLVPQQRPAGSGTMSDADLALFKRSLPSLINTPEGNKLIIQTMRGIAEYDRMGFEIIQKYRRNEINVAEAFQLLNERPDPTAWLTSNPDFSIDTETQTQTIQLPNGPTITFEE